MTRRRALAHAIPTGEAHLSVKLHGENAPALPVARKGQSGRVLLRPQRDHHAASLAEFCTAVSITAEIRKAAESDEAARRLQTIPGVGPITSSVFAATLPDVSNFKTARDLSAWLGLTPKPHSSGGKERLGTISKMGNRYMRRLLYLGAMATIAARRRKPAGDDWLWGMMQRKPVKLVAIALANRMARTVWALLRTGESYRASPG
jgi:transposase